MDVPCLPFGTYLGVSKKRGPQNRSQYTMIHVIRTSKKGPLFTYQLDVGALSLGWDIHCPLVISSLTPDGWPNGFGRVACIRTGPGSYGCDL